jgi:hypothetical protein
MAKDIAGMNPMLWSYLGFVVAILIFIWAAVEIGSRFNRRRKPNRQTLNTWIPLDSNRSDVVQEEPPLVRPRNEEDEQEDEAQRNLHIRAQQNGHYSQSKKPL